MSVKIPGLMTLVSDTAMGVPNPIGVVEDARSLHRTAQSIGVREVKGGHLHPAAEGSSTSGLRVSVLTRTPWSSRRRVTYLPV